MSLSFDPINKWIKITSGTSINALDIYNVVMDWCDAQENIGYSIPMSAVGKAPLGGGVYSDSIFILQNGWKIKLYDGIYQFTIFGTVITDDETVRTVPPDSGNVEVVFQVASQATIIPNETEWTQTEKSNIISKIGAIKPKTDNLPSDPASQSLVEVVKSKTDLLPTDPASEDSLQTISQEIAVHDIEVKGEPLENPNWALNEASLLEIRAGIREIASTEVVKTTKSIAQQLEKELSV